LPSYETLFQDIFLKNQLVIVGPEATSDWTSLKDWVLEDGSPNFHFLMENFGETTAPVADCNAQEFSAHPKTEMTVKNFLLYWQELRLQGYPIDGKCLYLKDWHFAKYFPSYNAYRPPAFLCSDWMNEFWDVRDDIVDDDDYRFVYMGPKNSWTPLHADVLHSYSWSANICGLKKWIFFPPGSEKKLKDKHEHLAFDLRSQELYDPDKYPDAASVVDNAITVLQNPGEIIFIPSGWYHQVFNLEDTISINHNWINGCSSHLCWEYVKSRLTAVQKEISDCNQMEGWDEQCQMILKADSGVDFVDFYNFLATIAEHRLKALSQYVEEVIAPGLLVDIHIKDTPLSGDQMHWSVLKDGSSCKHKHFENTACCWCNQLDFPGGKDVLSFIIVDPLLCNLSCDLVQKKEDSHLGCDLVEEKESSHLSCDLVEEKEASHLSCDLVQKKDASHLSCDLVQEKGPCDCFKGHSSDVPIYDDKVKVHQEFVVVSLCDGCDKGHPVLVAPLCDSKVKVNISCPLPCCDTTSLRSVYSASIHCSELCPCFECDCRMVKSGSENFVMGLLDHNCNIKIPSEELQCSALLLGDTDQRVVLEFNRCFENFDLHERLSGDRHFDQSLENGFKKNVSYTFESHEHIKRINDILSFCKEKKISEHKSTNSGIPPVFLCLFKGTVVNPANAQNLETLNEIKTYPSHSVDVGKDTAQSGKDVSCPSFEPHRHCPHWAHCGPNLALFDLCRVVDLVRDMQ
ncbi:unnamed protein product, partial [Lymnaea stagnalis]